MGQPFWMSSSAVLCPNPQMMVELIIPMYGSFYVFWMDAEEGLPELYTRNQYHMNQIFCTLSICFHSFPSRFRMIFHYVPWFSVISHSLPQEKCIKIANVPCLSMFGTQKSHQNPTVLEQTSPWPGWACAWSARGVALELSRRPQRPRRPQSRCSGKSWSAWSSRD